MTLDPPTRASPLERPVPGACDEVQTRLWRPPCSRFAHRRCVYTRTSQHPSVVDLQVRSTTVDAPVPRGTGWPGSTPGTLTFIPCCERESLERLDLLVAFLQRSTNRLVAPGVVDHIAPATVGLAPRHLGGRRAKHNGVTGWPGTRQRPGIGQIGQLAHGDH
jgi:hypothetical protein